MIDEVDETIASLLRWIRTRVENGCSGEELQLLPEMIRSTAALVMEGRYLRRDENEVLPLFGARTEQ
ncbi:hypothetical protein [Alicyclobacillus ferrooxydans]|uniref:Uncharacterized protein n=1 Tax=Alicyclobacillus ferrooxydans TaxID=471514 RepID=A0A0P9ETA0_9BACL|nr:hypothetical protein [Alicyclobacillus ferrooxydans]KPV41992.1 hypothetical protein AN477_19675 [Alicyclobacillus ferrooxydans]